MMDNDVYYRLYDTTNNGPSVVCMQWFDESGYDQERFLDDTRYEYEQEAENALLVHVLKRMTPESITLKAEAFDALVATLDRPARALPKLVDLLRQEP